MTLRDLLKTASGNLVRRVTRSLLTVVGITVGILTIVTMTSLGVGVHREFLRMFRETGLEKVNVYPKYAETDSSIQFSEPKRELIISQELVENMRSRADVVEVRPLAYLPRSADVRFRLGDGEKMAKLKIPQFFFGTYVGVHSPFARTPQMLAGRQISNEDRGWLVISARALQAIGLEDQADFEALVGQPVELVLKTPRGETQSFPFQVAGVMDRIFEEETDYFGVELATDDIMLLRSWWYDNPRLLEEEGYDAMTVRAASLNDAAQIAEDLKTYGFEVESLKIVLDMINKIMIVMQVMLGSIGGLALLVASVGIINTMIMAVYERTREIGILKAIGASPADIRILFVAEAAMIGLLGGVAGVVIGWLLGLGLNRLILVILEWQEIPLVGTFFVLPLWLVGVALVFATIVGLLAGLGPAARAARMPPLEALGYK